MSKRRSSAQLKKMFGMSTEEEAGQFGFEVISASDEEEESVDDEYIDTTYQPSASDEKMFNKDTAEDKKLIYGKKTKRLVKSATKKEKEFDIKKRVALEVSKYKNLFDVSHPKYMDKNLEMACWEKVAKEIGKSIDEAISYWSSLKRSARYYCQVPKIPFKSGAAADEIPSKYKGDWSLADVMSFYTPPALKNVEGMVSILNTSTEKPNSGVASTATAEIIDIDEASMSSVKSLNTNMSDVSVSVYVR